ncbi:MAG: ABC transporter ATP-binding protein YtrB [Variovorax sp.]|nr:MAG: ABC transporter ATP-binding protein YtrB [Variovorax sp.]
MLRAQGLTKQYGSHVALDRLDLDIRAGDIYCLLGANGAGKTTTINLFLHFIAPSAGTVEINGVDVTRHPLATKQDVAYIPSTSRSTARSRAWRTCASSPASRWAARCRANGCSSS